MESANTQNTKITLYWLNKSRAHRVLCLLEELKLKYEVKVFHRQKDMRSPPELKEIHPLGKSPVVSIEREGQAKPLILAESGLIVEYLIEHFGPQLAPKRYQDGQEGQVAGETEAWMRYRWSMHFSEGSFMPFLVMTLIPQGIRNGPVPFFLKPITNSVAGRIEGFLHPEIKMHLDFVESQLASAPDGGPYFCGNTLTGADIMMSFPLQGCKRFGLATVTSHPKICAYVERSESMPSFKQAVQKTIEFDGSYELF